MVYVIVGDLHASKEGIRVNFSESINLTDASYSPFIQRSQHQQIVEPNPAWHLFARSMVVLPEVFNKASQPDSVLCNRLLQLTDGFEAQRGSTTHNPINGCEARRL